MKKFLTVLSGVYLILVGAFVFFICILGLLSPPKASQIQIGQFNSIKNIFVVVFMAYASWPIVTGVGIILRKNWARISLFIISVFTIGVGLFSSFSFLAASLVKNTKIDYAIPISFKLAFLGLNFIFIIAIPLFFIIFFNSQPVKELFISKEKEGQIHRPFGITLIAFLSIFGSLFSAIFVFQAFIDKMPLLGPIILSGKSLKAYFLILTLIHIYIGIGLLKLQRAAWLTALCFNIFSVLMGITNIFTVTEGILSQTTYSFSVGNSSMSLLNYRIGIVVGLIVPAAIILYLISKRNLFLDLP